MADDPIPERSGRKYLQVVDYIEDEVGVDLPRDLKTVAISDIDESVQSAGLPVDLEKIGGTDQSSADVMAVLESVSDDDEFRVRLFGVDGGGGLVEIGGEALGTALGGTENAVVTKLAEALSTVANAQMRVDLENNNAGVLAASDQPLDVSGATVPTEQQTPVQLEDSGGTNIDPATDTTLTNTLSREIATWSAGTLATEQQTPVKLEDSSGTNIDPATDTTLTDTLSREIATWNAGTVDVTVTSSDPDAESTTLASAVDISGGVSAAVNKRDFTVYLENTGANSSDVTLSYSPDGGTTYFPDPDGAVTLASGATTVIEVGYDATHVEVSASNTEPFNVYIVER